jgi:hypothetical protein
MPRVEIPVTEIVRAGVAPPAQVNGDATNDHFIDDNDGTLFIEVVSSDGSPQTVSVQPNPGYNADGLTVSALSLSVPAGATRLFGPFKPNTFNQDTVNKRLHVDPSVSTNLKFRCYRFSAARG